MGFEKPIKEKVYRCYFTHSFLEDNERQEVRKKVKVTTTKTKEEVRYLITEKKLGIINSGNIKDIYIRRQ